MIRPLRGLGAHARDLREPCGVAERQALDEFVGRNSRQDADGGLGADGADGDELPEKLPFVAGQEAVQLLGIFPHMVMRIKLDFLSDCGQPLEG